MSSEQDSSGSSNMQSGSLAKTGSRGGEKALVNFDDVVEGDERDERVEDEGE